MDERTRRIGLNEALFREVNERVESLAREFGIHDETVEVLCECGDPICMQRIPMTLPEYRQVRADALTFAIVPGHDIPDVERVVERRGAYDVVMKNRGEPAEVAERTDRGP